MTGAVILYFVSYSGDAMLTTHKCVLRDWPEIRGALESGRHDVARLVRARVMGSLV